MARNGAVKAPQLRNVELTGPYFHTGSYLTLRQVVDFYMRGGDFPVTNAEDRDPNLVDITRAGVRLRDDDRASRREFQEGLPDRHHPIRRDAGHGRRHTGVRDAGGREGRAGEVPPRADRRRA